MPEFRKDYVLNKYVIIATERSKRPDHFKSDKRKNDDTCEKKCYFCPGNEKETPTEILRIGDEKNWSIRVFPNKFPAVEESGKINFQSDHDFFTYASAYGHHEVIVETPDHKKDMSDLDVGHIAKVLEIYKHRIEELSIKNGIRYVSIFKNHLPESGTSIPHSHSQVIALNLLPTTITKKERVCKEDCPYCRIINIEKKSHRRCFENETMVAFTPYASKFPFEIWIMPKRHVINITGFNEQEFIDMAAILKNILVKLKELKAPYNFFLHYGTKDLHFQLIITPRLSRWAGFENSSEIIINPVSPEEAAKFYRQQN